MGVVKIGAPNGRIDLRLDYSYACAMLDAFPYPDLAYDETLRAMRQAYPEQVHNDKLCDDYCTYCEDDDDDGAWLAENAPR